MIRLKDISRNKVQGELSWWNYPYYFWSVSMTAMRRIVNDCSVMTSSYISKTVDVAVTFLLQLQISNIN
jgi:hypothetical protein